MTLKFYIKKEEDSLYFEHFFKVVYNKARKIGGLWIKLRKLKYKKLFNLEGKYAIVISVILHRGEAGVIRETKITGRMPEVGAWHKPGGFPVFILQQNQALFIQKQAF